MLVNKYSVPCSVTLVSISLIIWWTEYLHLKYMFLLLALLQGDSGGPLHTADAKNVTEVIGKKSCATQYTYKIN